MRKRSLMAATALAVAAVALAACSSSSSGGGSHAAAARAPAEAPRRISSAAGGTGRVGVILPDTKSSARWENNDRPLLTKAFTDAGIKTDIQNAQGDVPKFGTICDAMVAEPVKVLIIVDLDSDSGAACLNKAKAAGIKTIDYDRLTLGGGANYYVSFDNVQVGKLQGEGLIKCLDAEGKTKANIVYINGAATDNNATLFKQGYAEALKAKIDRGDYKLVGDNSGEWDPNIAQTMFEQLLTPQNGKIDGAIVANDGMWRRVCRPSTGRSGRQDPDHRSGRDGRGPEPRAARHAVHDGLQGHQPRGRGASKIAIALIKGQDASALATSTVEDTKLNKKVAFAAATPVAITRTTSRM